MLSADLLRALYPSAPDAMIDEFAMQSADLLKEFGISAGQNRLHFFLAQIGHESGGKPVEENLNYSAKRMTQVWPKRFPTIASTAGFANNPRALANKVYGGRMGNAANNDDGWNYRGRGLIQITGKDGYQNTGDNSGDANTKLDLVGKPDLATNPKSALRVAASFWKWKRINAACDAGDFVKVTKLINGGTVGLQDRFKWLDKVQGLVPWPLGGPVVGLQDKDVALGIPQLKGVQIRLKALGLYSGSIDGIFGKKSREGLKTFQSENGLVPTGRLTQDTLAKLGL
jgi:putative chitinase